MLLEGGAMAPPSPEPPEAPEGACPVLGPVGVESGSILLVVQGRQPLGHDSDRHALDWAIRLHSAPLLGRFAPKG